jgi:TetR/AcrR family transcriptional regulator, tetracycline repressor protein
MESFRKISSPSAPRKAARSGRKSLNRQSILQAALEMIDADGIDSLSMRQLGRVLGVEAMSLYHYFKNRDDLLDGVVEKVMQEIIDTVDKNHRRNQNWKTTARKVITAYRIIGNRRPNGFRLVAQRTLRTVAAKKVGKVLADAFLESGLTSDEAVIAYRSITCFVAGFVLFETSRMEPAYTTGSFDLEFEKSLDIILRGIEECFEVRSARA